MGFVLNPLARVSQRVAAAPQNNTLSCLFSGSQIGVARVSAELVPPPHRPLPLTSQAPHAVITALSGNLSLSCSFQISLWCSSSWMTQSTQYQLLLIYPILNKLVSQSFAGCLFPSLSQHIQCTCLSDYWHYGRYFPFSQTSWAGSSVSTWK